MLENAKNKDLYGSTAVMSDLANSDSLGISDSYCMYSVMLLL